MNKNILNCLLIGMLLIGLNSCTEDADVSKITNTPFTIESVDSDVTLSEKSQVITVNFQLDEDQIVATNVQVAVDPVNTTATAGEDFNFSTTVVEIPAYVRKGSFEYEVLEDLDAEGDEKIVFTLSGIDDPFGASNTVNYTATIKDSVYQSLTLSFDWDGTFEFDGSTFGICDNVDLDVIVFDAVTGDVVTYDGATGACPEVIIVDDSWADGEYILSADMWENGLDSLFLFVDYPITLTATKGGVFKETFVPADFWTSEDEDQVNDGNGDVKPIALLEKNGTTYKVSDVDGNVIAQGFTRPQTTKVSTIQNTVGQR